MHDSYWTHANTVDKMSSIIRDTFVHLHSSDIMGRLLAEVRRPVLPESYRFLFADLHTPMQQVKERYQGYEIPVLSLNEREVELINSTTKVKIEIKGRVLRGSKSLRPIADTITLPTEADAAEELDGPLLDPSAEVVVHTEAEAEDEGAEDASAAVVQKTKKRKPATKTYVSLIDVLPPLPAKGTFSVETIKKSLYFFS